MPKYRLTIETGFAGAIHTDIIETDNELTDEELTNEAQQYMQERIEAWGERVSDDEEA